MFEEPLFVKLVNQQKAKPFGFFFFSFPFSKIFDYLLKKIKAQLMLIKKKQKYTSTYQKICDRNWKMISNAGLLDQSLHWPHKTRNKSLILTDFTSSLTSLY